MQIKHVVVVMFENRSYDNVLGWLYHGTNQPPYQTPPEGQQNLDGLKGDETNPDPNHAGQTIPVANQVTPAQIGGTGPAYAPTAIPLIDPGEPFSDMAQQIMGSASIPKSNPYADYPPEDTSSLNQGFTLNYAQLSGLTHPYSPVAVSNIPDIMNYLTPAQMPVSAFLANKYAVCDQWFGSAPTQTYTNRAFALCAAPGVEQDGKFSFIDDLQYIVHRLSPIPSVLSQLDAVLGGAGGTGPFWKVYFQDYSVAVATVPQVADAAASHDNVNLAAFDNSDWGTEKPKQLSSTTSTFVEDLQADALPPFSFIEPRYFDSYAPTGLPSASNHPGRGNFPGSLFGAATPIDAATGEVFLMQIYNLLCTSPCWSETLLIVTYDEHGGVYDHVPPPLATPPGGNIPPVSDLLDRTANGFNYNVLGGRVPAIVVSPQIATGTTIRAAPANTIVPPCGKAFFDHSSIVRTLWDIFGLSEGSNGQPSLTGRDLAAPSLAGSLTGEASNITGTFSGVIVAGAGSLTFTHTHGTLGTPGRQFILASAGPSGTLTATASQSTGQPTGEMWLSADAGAAGAANVYAIAVTVDIGGLQEGSYPGSVSIAASGVENPLSIPVTLIIKPLL